MEPGAGNALLGAGRTEGSVLLAAHPSAVVAPVGDRLGLIVIAYQDLCGKEAFVVEEPGRVRLALRLESLVEGELTGQFLLAERGEEFDALGGLLFGLCDGGLHVGFVTTRLEIRDDEPDRDEDAGDPAGDPDDAAAPEADEFGVDEASHDSSPPTQR